LINLASPDDVLYHRSIEAFHEELIRAESLGLRYLVAHPGAHIGSGEVVAIERIASALDEVHRRAPSLRVLTLLENTAGQGSCLGCVPEHLRDIINKTREPHRLGVCFDTCHAFAAGYPLAPASAYEETMAYFISTIGRARLRLFHLNDSRGPLGSRIDRHAHIGRGLIGLEAFRLLVNDRRFHNRPMLIETPREGNMDAVNLAKLRSLLDMSTQPSVA
jgi:deoxyribonuclease-4